MLRRFLADSSAQFGIAVTLMLVPLVAGLGVAVDYGNMTRKKANLQAALDAATIELAANVMRDLDDAELAGRGLDVLKANLTRSASLSEAGSIELFNHGLSQQADGRMHLSAEARLDYRHIVPRPYFALNPEVTTLSVLSQVTAATGDLACVYALNHTAARAFQADGNTKIEMEGCVIASNSSAADAAYVGGNGELAVECIQSSGGIDAGSGLTTNCARNREHAWRSPDPFEQLAEPLPPILLSNPTSKDTQLQPGRYSNLRLQNDIHLQPGLYYIEGSLTIQGTVTGSGVTFFMKDGGIRTNGSAALSITAPTSGEYAGMLFWSARDNTSDHRFNGNGATDLDGFLYFPKSNLTFNGNHGTQAKCLRIIADTVQMTGASRMKSDCSAELGGREARVAGQLYLSR
jgi:hypothetical protein